MSVRGWVFNKSSNVLCQQFCLHVFCQSMQDRHDILTSTYRSQCCRSFEYVSTQVYASVCIIMIKVLYVVAGGQKSFAHVQKVYWEVEKVPPSKKLVGTCLPCYNTTVHTHCWFWCTGEIFSAVGYSVTDTQDILTGRVSFVPSGGIRGIGRHQREGSWDESCLD